MYLTNGQFIQLQNMINDVMHGFVIETSGVGTNTPETLFRLQKMGYLAKDIPMSSVQSSYIFGKIEAVMSGMTTEQLNSMTLSDLAKEIGKVQLTPVEQEAIKWAEQNTGDMIQKLANEVNTNVSQSLFGEINQTTTQAMLKNVTRDVVVDALQNRKSRQNVVSEIGRRTGDWVRDLRRIAHTELMNARLNGQAGAILQGIVPGSKEKENTKVYKLPRPDACQYCKALYTAPSGNPYIFVLKDLIANGSNYGLKVANWKPTIGSVHPNCMCTLHVVSLLTTTKKIEDSNEEVVILEDEEPKL